jgi:hypothetical protein
MPPPPFARAIIGAGAIIVAGATTTQGLEEALPLCLPQPLPPPGNIMAAPGIATSAAAVRVYVIRLVGARPPAHSGWVLISLHPRWTPPCPAAGLAESGRAAEEPQHIRCPGRRQNVDAIVQHGAPNKTLRHMGFAPGPPRHY